MDNKARNSEKFIEIYNELDQYMKKYLNIDHNLINSELIIKMSEKNKMFYKYKAELLEYSKLRNAIVHNPYLKNANPIADPHDYILKRFENIKMKLLAHQRH